MRTRPEADNGGSYRHRALDCVLYCPGKIIHLCWPSESCGGFVGTTIVFRSFAFLFPFCFLSDGESDEPIRCLDANKPVQSRFHSFKKSQKSTACASRTASIADRELTLMFRNAPLRTVTTTESNFLHESDPRLAEITCAICYQREYVHTLDSAPASITARTVFNRKQNRVINNTSQAYTATNDL